MYSVPKQQAVWHTEEMNILLALQEKTNTKNFLHIYIFTLYFKRDYMLHNIVTLCPETAVSIVLYVNLLDDYLLLEAVTPK